MQPSHLNHLSRSGHYAAGRWLAEHAGPSELVLDTRGWAKFVSGHAGIRLLARSPGAHGLVTWRTSSWASMSFSARSPARQNAQEPAGLFGDAASSISRVPRRPGARGSALSLPSARNWEGLHP